MSIDYQLRKLKKRVRGVIANNNNTPSFSGKNSYTFSRGFKLQRSVNIELSIIDILEEARATLDSNTYLDFVVWTKKSIGYQLRRYPRPYGVFKQDEKRLEDGKLLNIGLSIKMIDANRKTIEEFITIKKEIYKCLLENNIDALLQHLDLMDEKCSESLWSISLRLTIYQLYFGLEKQKKYLSEIRSRSSSGLQPFIIHRLSTKNEQGTDVNRFRASLDKHFNDNSNLIDSSLRSYLSYKLNSETISEKHNLNEILYYEMKFNIVDQFETISTTLRRNLISRSLPFSHFLTEKEINIVEELVLKDYDKNILPHIFNKAFNQEQGANKDEMNILSQVSELLQDLLLFNKNYELSLNTLSQLCELLSKNDSFYYLKSLVLFFEAFDNSYITPIKNYQNSQGDKQFTYYIHSSDKVINLYSRLFNLNSSTLLSQDQKTIDDKFHNLFNLLKLKYDFTKEITSSKVDFLSKFILDDEFEDRLITFILDDPFDIANNFSNLGINLIPVLIVLHKYNTILFSDDLQSEISYILNTQLELLEIKAPSEIDASSIESSKEQLIYFFSQICVYNILDNCDSFESSKDLSEERRRILSNLIKIDPENSEDYHQEILKITSELKVKSGIEFLDGSRIHVDEEALKNLIIDEYQSSFIRYKNLVEAGIGVSEDFDEVIDAFLESKDNTKFQSLLTTPNNEADNLLLEIIDDMKNLFLHHPKFGLDGFLSLRIRHNSIVGFVRAAPEKCHLVTNQPSKGEDYKLNEFWMSKTPEKYHSDINRVLRQFTDDFDTYLEDIKSKYIQIESSKYPEGLLKLKIEKATLVFFRLAIQNCNLEEFVVLTLNLFWELLDPSLESIRKKFQNEFSVKVSEIHNRLSSNLDSIFRVTDKEYYETMNHLVIESNRMSSVNLQKASDWFFKHRLTSRPFFKIEEWLDIAIEAAKARHSSTQIVCNVVVENDMEVLITNLLPLADIIQIIVGNINDHVHMPVVSLDIEVKLDHHNKLIKYSFRNKVIYGMEAKNKELLSEIRENIEHHKYLDKIASEGNSGLYKIAAMVLVNDTDGAINFGYEDDYFILDLQQRFNPNSGYTV
ncbi:hypothetical protein [Psychrobacter sp. H8-1]|uniref:hypothetical protein n=1 Tax=Psychrobacter sp. H8-1 TaxID=2774129 RepID=UPI00191B618E|nr:hypothetical protein [Psychrobacter sp. H8-1]